MPRKRAHPRQGRPRARKAPGWKVPAWKDMIKTRKQYISDTYPDISKRMKKASTIRADAAVHARAREWAARTFKRVRGTDEFINKKTGERVTRAQVMRARHNKTYREKRKAIAEVLGCKVKDIPKVRKKDPAAFDRAIERYMYGSK